MFKCKHSCFICLFGFYCSHEGLKKWANETHWVDKPYFFKARNLKWQIFLLSKLGWGGGGWEIGLDFGWFFSDVVVFWFVTYPRSRKMNKTELPVIAFKMDLVSVSVTAKCTDKCVHRVPSVPYLEYVFGLTGPDYKNPTNLLLTLISACVSKRAQPPLCPGWRLGCI